jgi:hypothetical protein
MQLQEYDLKDVHISGANNFFADTLSRNPVGINKESQDLMRKLKEVFVAKLDLGIDMTLLKESVSSVKNQLSDPVLAKIWRKTTLHIKRVYSGLGIDMTLLKESVSSVKNQLSDPVLAKIWEDLEKDHTTYKESTHD